MNDKHGKKLKVGDSVYVTADYPNFEDGIFSIDKIIETVDDTCEYGCPHLVINYSDKLNGFHVFSNEVEWVSKNKKRQDAFLCLKKLEQ